MNTLETFFAYYAKRRTLKPTGAETYSYAIRSWGKALGTTRLCELSVVQFVNYFQFESSHGRSPYTIHGRRQRISTLWRHAAKKGLAPKFETPPPVKPPQKIVRAMHPSVVGRLVQEAAAMKWNIRRTEIPNAAYWPAFIAACYESALRRSDLMQLRWNPQGRWTLYQIKTGHPVTTEVSAETLALLEKLAKVSPDLLDLGWDRCSYCHRLKKIGKLIGVHVTPQVLRESAASEADRLHPGSATAVLGHRNDATTRRWYIDYGYSLQDTPRPRVQW